VIKINLKKLLIGILGSACCYLMINNFIVEMSVLKYILVEAIITFSHHIYEKIKHTTESNSEA